MNELVIELAKCVTWVTCIGMLVWLALRVLTVFRVRDDFAPRLARAEDMLELVDGRTTQQLRRDDDVSKTLRAMHAADTSTAEALTKLEARFANLLEAHEKLNVRARETHDKHDKAILDLGSKWVDELNALKLTQAAQHVHNQAVPARMPRFRPG